MTNARRIRFVVLVMGIPFILFLALLLGFKVLAIVDPEDAGAIELSSRVFGVSLNNDTGADINVQMRILCNGTNICGWRTMRDGSLKPHASLTLIAISGGKMDYRIVNDSGQALGCLALQFKTDLSLNDMQNLTIEASKVPPCANDAPSTAAFSA